MNMSQAIGRDYIMGESTALILAHMTKDCSALTIPYQFSPQCGEN